MANTFRLPAYDAAVPEANRLLQPIMQGWDAGLQDKQRGIENNRQNKLMGFRQQEVDQSKARFDTEQEEKRAHQFGKTVGALAQQPPDVIARVAPKLFEAHPQYTAKFAQYGINPADSVSAVKMLAQSYGDYDPLAIKAKQAQIAASEQSVATSRQSMDQSRQLFPGQLEAQGAQAAQIRQQTPEWRMENAQRFGIDTNTPEGKAFVISGQYAPKSDTVTVNEGQTIYQTGRDSTGKPTYTPIVQGNEKPPAEHTSKAANFVARMVQAERNVRKMVDGVDPVTGAEGPAFGAANNAVVAANMMPEAVRNMVISPQHQQYRQAAEQWIRAFLRKESGAAIGADEFMRDFVVYFPQPGDSPEVTAQKTEARHAAMAGIAGEAGNYFQRLSPKEATMLKQLEPNQKPQAAQDGAPVRVNSPQDAARLPPGTRFIGHDGVERVVR